MLDFYITGTYNLGMVKHYQIQLNNALQMKIVWDMPSFARYGFANVSVK